MLVLLAAAALAGCGADLDDARTRARVRLDEGAAAVAADLGAALREMLKAQGPRTLILRRECSLSARRGRERRVYRVESEDCTGCGICAQELACPAARWDAAEEKAAIDPALCVGCGVCAELCPAEAIVPAAGREAGA